MDETPRVRVETDPDGLNVALVIEDQQWVFSAGVMDPTPGLVFLRQVAQAAQLAESALRVVRLEQAGAWVREALVGAVDPPSCALCERGQHRGGACSWCGNPEAPGGGAGSASPG